MTNNAQKYSESPISSDLLAKQGLEISNQAFEKVLYLEVKISHDIYENINVIIVIHLFMLKKKCPLAGIILDALTIALCQQRSIKR